MQSCMVSGAGAFILTSTYTAKLLACKGHTQRMTLSPRTRPDYLLLYAAPTARRCLEAYATEHGVTFCAPYPNILAKAETLMPMLRQLVASLPPDLVAAAVGAALDGFEIEKDALPLPDGILDE